MHLCRVSFSCNVSNFVGTIDYGRTESFCLSRGADALLRLIVDTL